MSSKLSWAKAHWPSKESKRAPEFNEHCDEILAGIGCDSDEVLELKVTGVVA